MFVLSIIACRMFEDELVCMIEKHGNFATLVLVEDENSTSIARKLEHCGRAYKVLPLEEVPHFITGASPDSTIVVIHMLDMQYPKISEEQFTEK